MGYPMAQNWVTQRIAERTDVSVKSGFVICDADIARATSFAKLLNEKFHSADISVAVNPAE
jgi:hypothetical protein